MEKSVILELVTDSCYLDRISMTGDKQYEKYFNEFNAIVEKLCVGLSKEERFETINKLTSAQGMVEALYADKHFVEGFKLGLKVALETFTD